MHHPSRLVLLLMLLLILAGLAACGSAPSAPAALARPASAAAHDGVTAATTTAPLPPTPSLQPSASMLRVHFIDVGQGDSIFIQTPDGATALIDGGYGNGMALAYLKQQKVAKINVMIVSHPHADHIGGLVEVLKAMPIGVVWTSGASHTTGTYEALLDAIADAKVPYREAKTGDAIAVGTLQLMVLRSEPNAANLNDTSLVLRLADGHVSFLFTGDAEQPSEDAMLRTVKDQLRSTILKVGHHGSYTSSSPAFLAAVQPQVAVYSAGRGNSYGHPHQETIRALEAAGATIYGTDRDGTVLISTDGTTYQVATRHANDTHTPALPLATATASTPAPDTAPNPTPSPRANPRPLANPCRQRIDPTAAPNAPIVITGVDKVAEVVTITNIGSTQVDLAGWTICSLLGTQLHARLEGTLAPGESRAIPSQAGGYIWNNRSAERGAVYNNVGELISYWREERK